MCRMWCTFLPRGISCFPARLLQQCRFLKPLNNDKHFWFCLQSHVILYAYAYQTEGFTEQVILVLIPFM